MDFLSSFRERHISSHPLFSRVSTMRRLSRARPSPPCTSQVVAVFYIELVAALRKTRPNMKRRRRRRKRRRERGREERKGRVGREVRNMHARRSFNNARFLFPSVTSCPLLLYERIIIGRSARANAHAEFLSRRAHLSAFRVATRAEEERGPGATDRN